MTDAHDQENSPRSYPVPRYVTAEAKDVFCEHMDGEAQQLAGDIDYRAIQNQNGGRVPLQPAEVVRQAIEDRQGVRHGRGDPQTRAALKEILLTFSIVGLTVMAGFLSHSTWQLALFIGFVVIGVVGLVLTWRGRRDHVRQRNRDHR